MALETESMKGKVVLITGATSGIGKATAFGLADMGAQLILVSRNTGRLRSTMERISNQTGNNELEVLTTDLSSMEQVRRLADHIKNRHSRLNVLVNNAGTIMGERKLTADGFEYTFALDHLSPFLLTNLLLDTLTASAPSRVITVSSTAHRMGAIHFDDLMLEKDWGPFKAYSQAKLANILFTHELARRLRGTGVTANCVHPGGVRTHFGDELKGAYRVGIAIARPFEISPRRGARTVIYLASSPDVSGVSGKYFYRKKPRRSSPESNDQNVAKRLWEVSAKLVGIEP